MPFLTVPLRARLFEHMRAYAAAKNIRLLAVNGHLDHVHCLLALQADQTVATVMQLLKGESSFWAGRQPGFPRDFGWQDDYVAVSVSQSAADAVRAYIDGQEAHHRNKTFDAEYQEFLTRHPFEMATHEKG